MNKGKERKIKMRKSKSQKGITLIALIITIVVLLILATVTITSMSEYDIIGKANTAAEKYENKVGIEDNTLKEYSSIIDKYMGNSNSENEKQESTSVVGTWIFNNDLSVAMKGLRKTFNGISSYEVNFSSNGSNYTSFSLTHNTDEYEDADFDYYFIVYDSTRAYGGQDGKQKWLNENYKTINIIEEPTDTTFISWLKENASLITE